MTPPTPLSLFFLSPFGQYDWVHSSRSSQSQKVFTISHPVYKERALRSFKDAAALQQELRNQASESSKGQRSKNIWRTAGELRGSSIVRMCVCTVCMYVCAYVSINVCIYLSLCTHDAPHSRTKMSWNRLGELGNKHRTQNSSVHSLLGGHMVTLALPASFHFHFAQLTARTSTQIFQQFQRTVHERDCNAICICVSASCERGGGDLVASVLITCMENGWMNVSVCHISRF